MTGSRATARLLLALIAALVVACARESMTPVPAPAPGAPAATAVRGDAPPARGPARPAIDAPLARVLSAHLEAELEHSDVVGICAAIASLEPGEWAACAGISDIATGAPLDVGARFRLASLTKTAVSARVVQLAASERIDLDAPARTYVPDLPLGGDATIRQLLEHRAGLPDYLRSRFLLVELDSNPARTWTAMDLLRIAAMEPPDFSPGAGRRYSNTGYIVLGLVIERVGGEPLATALSRPIFVPLGLPGLELADPPASPDGLATGHTLDAGPGFVSVPRVIAGDAYGGWDSAMWAAGALVGSALDAAAWAAAAWGGEVPGAPAVDGCAPAGSAWSCALGEACAQGGRTRGFTSFTAYVPGRDLAVAVLANSETPRTQAIAAALLEAVAAWDR